MTEIHEATKIDYFFLHSFASLIETEKQIASRYSIAGCNEREDAIRIKKKAFLTAILPPFGTYSEREVRDTSKRTRCYGCI